jgi:trimethylamine--corrinoid protein Co-methyltransferase
MFINTMPRYEILSADAIGVLDRGWRRIVSQIGVQFAKPEAVELFAKAGQRTDGEVVYLDPDFVLEQMAKVPREFDVQARNPAHSVHIGGDTWCSARCTAARSCARATCAATPP